MNAGGPQKNEESLGNNLIEDLTLPLGGCGLVNLFLRDILQLLHRDGLKSVHQVW